MDALDALFALERFGIRPGLDTIRLLVRAMGDPQSSYRTVIVAGTNGKGSVVAMADSALRAAGLRVGRYTSPHLNALAERFVVDGAVIPARELRREAARLHEHIDRLAADGRLPHPPTFFEATTAIALSWFRRTGVDLALLEVGLGGRCDATNIVTPVAGVITPIGLEHQQYLGDTLEAIAAEKAGVIKTGMVVVTTETTPAVVALFEETCRRRGARLVRADVGTTVRVALVGGQSEIRVTTPRRAYPSFRLGLVGAHQVSNAIGTIRLLEALSDMGVPVGADAIVTGLSRVVWPGRLELVRVEDRGAIPARRRTQPGRGDRTLDLPARDVSGRAPDRVRGDARQERRRYHRRARPVRHPIRLHRPRHPACSRGERARRAGATTRRVDTGHRQPNPLACSGVGMARVADRVCDRFDRPRRRRALGDRPIPTSSRGGSTIVWAA